MSSYAAAQNVYSHMQQTRMLRRHLSAQGLKLNPRCIKDTSWDPEKDFWEA